MPVNEITACVLDRPRHARMIEEIRATGAAIRLIGDGDVAGVIHTTSPDETGIDIYMGIGGAPEGVLAAAALRCIGGQMQGRLVINSGEQRERAMRMGVADLDHKYDVGEMARGDVLFAATGVTDGNLLAGVKFGKRAIITHTVVMRSSSRHGALDQGRAPGPGEVHRPAVRGRGRACTNPGGAMEGARLAHRASGAASPTGHNPRGYPRFRFQRDIGPLSGLWRGSRWIAAFAAMTKVWLAPVGGRLRI